MTRGGLVCLKPGKPRCSHLPSARFPGEGWACGTSGWMSLRMSVRVSEQRATEIQVTWRGTEAAGAPGAAERSVVARAFRPSSACLPEPLAFPYHFSASCYLSDILAKLNWALGSGCILTEAGLSCFLSKPYPLFQAQLMKHFQVFPKPAVSSFPTLARALEYFCRQPLGVWYSFESPRHPW